MIYYIFKDSTEISIKKGKGKKPRSVLRDEEEIISNFRVEEGKGDFHES